MSAWTFIAQRATTGEWLDWDLPIELGGLEWQLSGPGSLKGTISPDAGGLRAPDGRLVLEEWGTLLYAEHEGEIRWGGILISSSFNDEVWELEAAGFSTYPHELTYEGEFSQIQVDPLHVFRHLWEHIQSFQFGNLGVAIVGATDSPVRLGPDAVAEYIPPKYAAAKEILAQFNKGEGYPVYEDWTWPGAWPVVNDWNNELLAEYGGAPLDKTAATAWLQSYVDAHEGEVIQAADAKPYELIWTDHPDVGQEIDELTKSTPFDWVERHRWDLDNETVSHEIEVGYPRLGRRRDDLAFVQGDNVLSVVSVESNGDEYANTILGLGAGEGRAMLRRSTGIQDGRLRRVAVYSDKSISDPARLDALIAEELNARRAAIRITSLDVLDHPNASLGSWDLGDDVLVRAEIPWLGEIEVWCRITGWTLTGEHTATLAVVRSDLYRYGGITS